MLLKRKKEEPMLLLQSLKDDAPMKSMKAPEASRLKKLTRMLLNPVASAVESEALTKMLRMKKSRMSPAESEEDEVLETMVQLPLLSDAREAQEMRLHSTRLLRLPLGVLKELAETPCCRLHAVGGGWESNPGL